MKEIKVNDIIVGHKYQAVFDDCCVNGCIEGIIVKIERDDGMLIAERMVFSVVLYFDNGRIEANNEDDLKILQCENKN